MSTHARFNSNIYKNLHIWMILAGTIGWIWQYQVVFCHNTVSSLILLLCDYMRDMCIVRCQSTNPTSELGCRDRKMQSSMFLDSHCPWTDTSSNHIPARTGGQTMMISRYHTQNRHHNELVLHHTRDTITALHIAQTTHRTHHCQNVSTHFYHLCQLVGNNNCNQGSQR